MRKLMERGLKERVIGAVVLVLIAVLVVPVFLDGPSTDAEMVSEPVTLPGQNGQSRKRQTIVLERDRDQPVPASARQPSDTPVTGPQSGEDKPLQVPATQEAAATETRPAQLAESKPPAKAEPKPATKAESEPAHEPPAGAANAPATVTEPESATGMWAVQLGSFSNKANAERLAAGLREKGYAAFLSELHTGSGDLHRVRIGPQEDRDSAEAVAARLGQDGQKGQVVPHP